MLSLLDLKETFKGKKTYTTAIVAILTAALAYFSGESTLMAALELAFTGAIGMTLRASVTHAIDSVLGTTATVDTTTSL